MTFRNHAHVPAGEPSFVPVPRGDESAGRAGLPAYCLRCDSFVKTTMVPSGSSAFKFILAGLAAALVLPELITVPASNLIILSALFGAALALYVARRRSPQKEVCGLCGSPYIYVIKDRESPLRRAA